MRTSASSRAKSGTRASPTAPDTRAEVAHTHPTHVGGPWEEVRVSVKDWPLHWVIQDAVAAFVEAFLALA